MKTVTILAICLLSICFNAFGQSCDGTIFVDKTTTTAGQSSISPNKNISVRNLNTPEHDPAYYLEKSRAQKISGLVLVTGGSVISFLGIRSGLDISRDNSLNKNLFRTTGNQNFASPGLALTGLVMMAGSIPYFIYSLKNKNKAGLKLSCQKTFFGTSARACKKINSLTFAIPVGK